MFYFSPNFLINFYLNQIGSQINDTTSSQPTSHEQSTTDNQYPADDYIRD